MLNCVLIACLMKYVKMYNWICRCCVCLGEFEMREELQQIPLCKHVFHPHCISHWLHSNSTCPLCRCSVIPITKHPLSHPLVIPDPIALEDPNFNPDQQMVYPDQGEQVVIVDTNLADYYCSIEEHMVILVEGSSSTSTSRWNNHLFSISKSMCNFFFWVCEENRVNCVQFCQPYFSKFSVDLLPSFLKNRSELFLYYCRIDRVEIQFPHTNFWIIQWVN